MGTRTKHLQKLLRMTIQATTTLSRDTARATKTLKYGKVAQPAVTQARMYSTLKQEAHRETQNHATEAVMDSKNKWLAVTWLDGSRTDHPYVWLRDNCQCSQCFHPVSQARLYLMQDLDINIQPRHAQVNESGDVHIIWPDGHESHFNGNWLKERSFTEEARMKRSKIYSFEEELWGAKKIKEKFPKANYEELMQSDQALYDFLSEFSKYGLGIISNMAGRGGLLKFCNRVAFPRVTHYGEMFEVETKEDPSNVSYTATTLGLHTDLIYYDYQPGIQLLNCVQQAECGGGENGFADAFYAGYAIKENRPDLYTILTKVPLDSWDIGIDYTEFFKAFRSPVIRLDENEKIWQIRYNNQVRDSFMDMSANMVGPVYEALKEFDNTLYHPEHITKKTLESGEMVLFDNWRVMHCRFGYTTTGSISRYLEGGYLDWDEVHSTLRVLENKLKP